ncbi:hypothetical protein ABT063_27480 [Streptomyces sp. NPDC002838]|uniref:hypothetical protein n=1 Tax=Streptomyces sp. NPDC002838 TaxID=3154436 RepID=UPI00331EB798
MLAASDPYEGHNYFVLLAIMLLAGPAALLALAGYAAAAGRRWREGRPGALWECCAALALAASIAVYMWGCLHLMFVDDRNMVEECAKAGGEDKARQVDGYIGEFVPLRFICHMPNGRSYTAIVPDYINPTAAAFLLLMACCICMSVIQRRAAAPGKKESRS